MARNSPGRAAIRQPVEAARRRALRWRFLADVYGELAKAEWPSRQEATRLTGVVIALSAAVGALLGVVDLGFSVLARYAVGG